MTVHTERRTQTRKRPLSLVYVELPPSNGGMMRDLSDQGFALRAMMPLQPSEKLPFAFSLDNGVRVDGEAIVLRVEDGGNVAALEFAGLPAHSRDQIRRWLEKFDEPLSRESALPKPPKEPASTLKNCARKHAQSQRGRRSRKSSLKYLSPHSHPNRRKRLRCHRWSKSHCTQSRWPRLRNLSHNPNPRLRRYRLGSNLRRC